MKEEQPPEPEWPAAGGATLGAPEVQRQSRAAAASAPRRSCPPVENSALEPRGTREAQPGLPGFSAGLPGLCAGRLLRGRLPGVAWVGYRSSDGLLFPASPNLLRPANSIKIKPQGRFFFFFKSKQR